MKEQKGLVLIVGAGPGDPGLITLKGVRALMRADVIVYDQLASAELLQFAQKDARLIYVGKKGGDHTIPQREINDLLVLEAKK
ncbi:MAG: SAM-dependent methyltransferase, partial [Deltaproteobacteria bacterium]|nr:SAM-dependent methyltransferase [Deltaproteobacteria bacterium]